MASEAPAPQAAETAVRDYLTALRDPDALRDEQMLADLQERLDSSADPIERLQLREELKTAQTPSLQRYEADFVSYARPWADQHGITPQTFADEGVPPSVLRQAGLMPGGRRRTGGRRGAPTRTRSRVTTEEVRSAIPRVPFTIRDLQERSGASPAVVRKVVQEELASGNIETSGTDPQHRGPGRAPVVYQRT